VEKRMPEKLVPMWTRELWDKARHEGSGRLYVDRAMRWTALEPDPGPDPHKGPYSITAAEWDVMANGTLTRTGLGNVIVVNSRRVVLVAVVDDHTTQVEPLS